MEITRHGTAIMTNGTPTAIGEKLPAFTVKDAQGQSLTTQDLSRRLTLISVVPDINTRVCSISTKHFNEDMDAFDNVDFLYYFDQYPSRTADMVRRRERQENAATV